MLALVKGNIEGVKIAGTSNREQTYKLVTQFSLGPAENADLPGARLFRLAHQPS